MDGDEGVQRPGRFSLDELFDGSCGQATAPMLATKRIAYQTPAMLLETGDISDYAAVVKHCARDTSRVGENWGPMIQLSIAISGTNRCRAKRLGILLVQEEDGRIRGLHGPKLDAAGHQIISGGKAALRIHSTTSDSSTLRMTGLSPAAHPVVWKTSPPVAARAENLAMRLLRDLNVLGEVFMELDGTRL